MLKFFQMENQKNKIAFITGANGFIGSHLACKLVEKGLKIIGLSRTAKSKNQQFNKYVSENKIELITGDISNFDYKKMPKADYIFHVAGKVSVWGDIESFMEINYEGTKRLLNYAKKLNLLLLSN